MKVLYFAHIKDLIHRDVDNFAFSSTITVQEFRHHLTETYPQIGQEIFQIAVNEEFVQDTDIIQPTDTVALIPPVSGG